MKNITTKTKILLPLVSFLAIAPGCSSHKDMAKTDDGSAAYGLLPQQQAEDQFLKDLGSLPADQRQAYLDSHRDAVERFQADPDKSKMAQIQNLVPQRTR